MLQILGAFKIDEVERQLYSGREIPIDDYIYHMIEKSQLHPVEIDYVELEAVQKPDIVHKYRSWKQDIYHDNVLLKNQLYMSAPSDFEDKLDCKNPTRYDAMTEEETKIWIERKIRDEHPRFNDKAVAGLVEHYYRRSRLKDADFIGQFEKEEWNQYNRLTGILSVTHDPLSEAMWVKYANSHTGISYGFDTNALIRGCKIGGGGDVQYVDELPLIHPLDDIIVQATNRVYYKTKDWEFEQEYRLRTFSYDDRVRTYPNEALMEVVLGKDFEMEQLPEIIEILKTKGGHVKLFKIEAIEGLLSKSPILY